MEKKRFIIAITFFVLMSLLVNFLSLTTIFDAMGFNKGVLFCILLTFLSLSYPLTVILERYRPMVLTKGLYTLASIWIGIAFFSIFIFIVYHFVQIFFNIDGKAGSAFMLSFIIIMSGLALINGRKLKINLVDVKIKGLKKELKVVHLSDVHIGAIHRKAYLEMVVSKTNSLNPDLVVITGDLVDGSSIVNEKILSPINKIKSPVFFIIGNHEIYEGLSKVIPIFGKTKMKILRDTKRKFKEINLIGIDYSDLKSDVVLKLERMNIDKDKINVLLYHAPIFKIRELEKLGIDLHLAGHTHNGQIFPLNLLVKLIFPYSSGLYKSDKSGVFVSVGTGTWGPPMRLGSKNEINLINLRKE